MNDANRHRLIPEAPHACWEDYLAHMGGSALVLARRTPPEEVLQEVQHAGLRGRGGAGFPTGTKWATVRKHPCPTRFVVCNAAEGEPGTFKDRWLLRHNPFAVLEGMLIAAHVIGTDELYVGIKASFKPEIDRLRQAIEEMTRAQMLQSCRVHVVEGPEEYLFGEEKALLEVLGGNDPLPREADSPPYEVGLFPGPGAPNPALVNNAQTFAHVPSIILHGASSFRKTGTHDTPGTILFTVSGDVERPGVYEAEAGITLRALFEDLAGGPRPGRTLKGALAGVSAAPIAADRFDTPADFAHLHLVGSGLGSAGFMVLDDATSIPRVAQSIARFLYVESCNQCAACKNGLRTASEAIDELFDPRTATEDDLPRALFGARSGPQGNRCYLPVQGSVVLPGLARRFPAEFEAQLHAPASAPAPWPIPKLVDFDPAVPCFSLDESQARKKPDWTYAAPVPTPAPVRSAQPPAPHDHHTAPVAIRLAPDVARALRERAQAEDVSVEALANRALREWTDH